jgi:putative PIN family toxin of toxin-antitoxin system
MRIAIDTNCLIAALTKPRGSSGRLVQAWLEGRVQVVASEATAREAELVLGRWLERVVGRERLEDLLEALRTHTVWVDRPARIDDLPLKDAGDVRMVETAVAGEARYVVTTDEEFLSKRGYGDVEFVTPAEALRSFTGRSGDTREDVHV